MTVEEALQVLQGSPTQEELFTALLVLAEQDETAYVGALPRAAEILSAMSGQDIPREQINTVVRQLQDQTPQTAGQVAEGVTLSGEVTAAPEAPASELSGLTGGTIAPPPPIPPEEQQVQQGPSFIGVPPDFRAQREFTGMPGDIGQGAGSTRQQVGIPPRYKPGDQWQPAGMGPVSVRRRQKELEKAGLLEPGSYTPGFWDAATAGALETAMGYANTQGRDVDSVLTMLASLPRNLQEEAKPKFVAPPELKPDPAVIAQRVKSEFRNRLGREPTDAEMGEFAGYLSGQYAAAHDAFVEQERAAFDVENQELPEPSDRAFQSDIGGRPISDSEGAPTSFTNVDPVARFQEAFDRRFGSEERFIEDQENTFQASERIMNSLASLQSRVTQ